ncbi:MAG TPA: sodium-dependent transporter [Fermentimonas caenicola]|jgi:NSS family neurotransmitter:Na+ symporter|uniref:sodium-dependent transporter n=1 Tax=Lascolabacillus TaxID=1924067 RepID=UPI0006B33040|nr:MULTISPECIES: sodium-dependent transporter [Lascolabacillus]MBP6197242.1 sodium-dependent transporter [Fermentimonas sp.]HHU42683.1 sodium-dependent transporter [Fermentimonas caenicola]MBP7104261.1 sodium-dependent transporter [Fermentimonas sp.]MCK9501256.1 sodium-dependent transporter [Lascolabacillus sp.]MDD2606444.1 sodium-dependent transporter [Lascolabacillus sp.]
MENIKRVTFTSKIGVVAAAAGSAVGLGNIWRFPSQTADGGGAIFIFVYIACILFFGIPVMMSEFIIGRSARANTAGAFHILAPGTQWKWIGRLGVLTGFIIMGFYMVVAGWTLIYFLQSITGNLHTVNDFSIHFTNILNDPLKQSVWMIVFSFLTSFFILSGVRKGIEKSAKIFMPILFLLLIILAIRSITLEGAIQGLNFLFKPNMEHVKQTVFLDAMGQAFFSLSIGMGCLITYGSYFNKSINLTKTAVQVSILDTLVAVLSGVIIFPAAFALTSSPDTIVDELVTGGPGLLFITIPELLNQMPASMAWSALFFCLLALAALTSTISLMEVVTVYLFEEYKISRRKSTIFVTLGVIILGIISSYSSVFFNILDMASAKYMLPIGGLFISIFVGWYLKQQLVTAQITNEGKLRFGVGFIKFYIFLLRFIAPIAILSIFVYGLTG